MSGAAAPADGLVQLVAAWQVRLPAKTHGRHGCLSGLVSMRNLVTCKVQLAQAKRVIPTNSDANN